MPDEVGDGRPKLVVFAYDGLAVGETVDEVPELVERMYSRSGAEGSALRRLRNHLVFVAADGRASDGMRRRMRSRLALQRLKEPDRLADLAEHQQEKIRDLEARSEQELAIAVQQCYRHVFYPSRNRIGARDVSLAHTAVDIPSASNKPGAGQQQIARALRDLRKLRFHEPDAPAYVRDRTPLRKGQMTTLALRDEFRRDPALPMLLGDDIFIRGIRRGIEQSDYVYQRHDLLFGAGDPPADIQIDEHAVVMTMAYARNKGIWPRSTPPPTDAPLPDRSPPDPSPPDPSPPDPSPIHNVAAMSPTTTSRARSTMGAKPAPIRTGAAGWSGRSSARFDNHRAELRPHLLQGRSVDDAGDPVQAERTKLRGAAVEDEGPPEFRGRPRKAEPRGHPATTSTLAPSTSTTSPTTSGVGPKRVLRSPSPRTRTGAAPGRSSSGVKARPSCGEVRSTSKNDAVTNAAWTRCGSSGPVKLACPSRYAATPSRVRLSSAQRKCSASDVGSSSSSDNPGATCLSITSRSESGTGSGRSTTPLTTVKMAMLAPIPTARVARATRVKPGLAAARRHRRRSCIK